METSSLGQADRLGMERRLGDLVNLSHQQASTIRRLEAESLAKSERLSEVQARGQATVSSGSERLLRPSLHTSMQVIVSLALLTLLALQVAPQRLPTARLPKPQPLNPAVASTMRMAEEKLVQLQQQVPQLLLLKFITS